MASLKTIKIHLKDLEEDHNKCNGDRTGGQKVICDRIKKML